MRHLILPATATATVAVALLCALPAAAQTYTPTCGVAADQFDHRGERFALLASVNEYAPNTDRSDLKGTGNDMERLCRVLVDRYGFDNSDVLRLHGPTASKAGLLAGLDALAARSKAGHVLVFGYAGHGSHVPDEDPGGDEPDERDETLCPWDAQTVGDLRDDVVHEKLDAALAGGAHLVTIFDSCHSGTATRGDPKSPASEAEVTPRSAKPSPVVAESAVGKGDGGNLVGGLARNERMVLIAAAADHQLAKEIDFEVEDGKMVRHGAFSHSLLTVLETARPGAPWQEIVDRARRGFPRTVRKQTPQFAGNLRLEAFGTREVTVDPHFVVESVESDGDVIKVLAGQLHGIEKGALLSVYARGTKRLRGEEGLVGIYEVTWTGGTKLTAKRQAQPLADGSTPAVRPIARAGFPVALLVPGGAFEQRRVFIDPATVSPEWATKIRSGLGSIPLVEAAPEGEEPGADDLLIYEESGPRGCIVIEGGPGPWPGGDDQAEDCLIDELVDVADDEWELMPQEPRHVWDALGRFAAWERIRSIRHDDPDFRGEELLEVSVTVRDPEDPKTIVPTDPPDRVEAETGNPVFEVGETVVVNYRKLGEGTLFVSTLYLSNDGAVMWLDKTNGGPVVGEVDLTDFALELGAPCGTDHIKVFVTEKKRFDASSFDQRAPSIAAARSGGGQDDLQWWVESLLLGTSRAAKKKRSYGPRWTTIDVPIKITGCPE
jgi:hypothetical protein